MLRIDVDHKVAALQYAIPPRTPSPTVAACPKSGPTVPQSLAILVRARRYAAALWGRRSGRLRGSRLLESAKNYGWNVMEGMHCFNPSTGCDMTGLTLPIVEYAHSEGEAVMGGYVYKGNAISGFRSVRLRRLHQRHDLEPWSSRLPGPGRATHCCRPDVTSVPSVRTRRANSMSSTTVAAC